MATLVKIHGLDRSAGASVGSASGQDMLSRGFRVPSGYGLQYPSGTKAFSTIGTVGAPNAAVTYTVKGGGTWGNAVKVIQNAPSGANTVITPTFTATTGALTLTITPSTTDTAATLVTKVNQDPVASQYVTASLVGTGASAPVASANANAVVTIAQGTGTSTGGTFTLTFPGYGTTSALAFNATGATVATAVQTLMGGTVTGSATTLPASTTLTFTGTLAATPIPAPTVDSSALTPASTYTATVTTYGTAAAGTLNGGSNSGTGQAFYVNVNSKGTHVVDSDEPQTARVLTRLKHRYLSLGQP
jgi:hypothetical protein